MLKPLLREPLLHFFLAAAAIFFTEMALRPAPPVKRAGSEIVVSREALLTFIQYRTKQFDTATAAKTLAGLSDADRTNLIDDFVREEALYREAASLGLDQSDYVIKRRMIQKLDFITRSFSEAEITITSEQVRAHYQTHLEEYREPPSISFTHVFFEGDANSEELGMKAALQKARRVLPSLEGEPFEAAPRFGDLFPYGVNFVDRPKGQIESLFGEAMSDALFSLEAKPGAWRGPLRSNLGAHLVMVTARRPARTPPLEEIRKTVEAEARVAEIERRRKEAANTIIQRYSVTLAPGLEGATEKSSR